ncbi:MAG: hypothetical protein WC307_06875 [Candidatus Nanoarchaeia archaeon]|jgi:hypothetical protein
MLDGNPEDYIIKLEDIEAILRNIFKAGYGDTIELKINGEYYEVIA